MVIDLHTIRIAYAGCIIITALSFCAYGQGQTRTKGVNEKKVNVELRAGNGSMLSPFGKQKQSVGFSTNNSIVVNKSLSPHLKLEAMINYNMLMNGCCIDKIFGQPTFGKESTITLPVTTQYFPLRNKSRVQPYLGAGVLYSLGTQNRTPGDREIVMKGSGTGTKYISLIFTQGVTYKVNTKIEVYQTTLFDPEVSTNIGFNVGVGYSLR